MKSLSLKKFRLLAVLLAGALAAPAQTPAAPAEPPLRRIDEPAAAEKSEPTKKKRVRPTTRSDQPPFGNQTVPAGSTMRDAVAIFGSIEVHGGVQGDAVAIGGPLVIAPDGRVEGGAVAVFGRMGLRGRVGRDAVSVIGGASEIDASVGGDAVVVLGGLTLGPNAVIERDVVVIGGQLTRDPAAIVRGRVTHFAVPGLGDLEWLVTWLRECAVWGRPLAFGRELGWAWSIAFGFLGFYLLLTLLFSRGVTQCAETFERRPATSILSAMLTVLLSPVAFVILAITIVGGLVVPFLAAALFFAGLFGKVVMLAWLGRRFTKFFGDGPLGGPVFAVLVGGLVLMLVYTIPFVGITAYKLVSWLGLGVVVLTIVEAMQRNKRPPAAPATAVSQPTPPPVPAATAPVAALAAVAPANVAAPVAAELLPPLVAKESAVPPEATGPASAGSGFAAPPPAYAARAAVPAVPPPVSGAAIDETALPRATLLIRLAALALDGVLIGALLGFLSSVLLLHNGPGSFVLVFAIYGAAMWKTKGTTIGGVVCGLKVVRLDGRAIDWPTAAVRALGCFLSLVVAGLGFIWVAFDDEQQSWHDKIAGTIVVRMPKGTSLV